MPRSDAPRFPPAKAVARTDLIVDMGVGDGTDTAFYLAKGFAVVGVESDPTAHDALTRRFAPEIASGRLQLLHRAAGQTAAQPPGQAPAAIDWPELATAAGIPYYLKIDIDGGEPAFLRSMLGTAAPPPYISAAVQTFQPIQLFHDIGYRHFRLVNQTLFHGLTLPDPPREGVYVPRPDPQHWSGPFGREAMGTKWFGFEEITAIHAAVHRLWTHGTLISGWFDCHACLPEFVA